MEDSQKQKMEEIYQNHAQAVYKYLCSLTHDIQLAEELTPEYHLVSTEKNMADADKKEIDFLKKTRKKMFKTVFISVGIVLASVALIAFLKLFVFGFEVSAESVEADVDIRAAGKQVEVRNIISASSAIEISEILYEETEEQTVKVHFRGVLASPFHYSRKLQTVYECEGEVSNVYLGDRIVQYEGYDISKRTSQVYQARNPYVGDIAANYKIAGALGMGQTLGEFDSELQTEKEPYGWTICLKTVVPKTNSMATEKKMKAYAYVLLATIDNLGYVTYDYEIETYISGMEKKTLTVTTEDAWEAVGKNIKDCAKTPSELQRLMWDTEIDR